MESMWTGSGHWFSLGFGVWFCIALGLAKESLGFAWVCLPSSGLGLVFGFRVDLLAEVGSGLKGLKLTQGDYEMSLKNRDTPFYMYIYMYIYIYVYIYIYINIHITYKQMLLDIYIYILYIRILSPKHTCVGLYVFKNGQTPATRVSSTPGSCNPGWLLGWN